MIYSKGCLNRIILLLLLFFYSIFNIQFSIPVKPARTDFREKACFSNIRAIQGAVEMYNMDYAIMMKNLDLSILQKGKYLKTLVKPEKECEYLNQGDLDNGGYVYCKIHGSLQKLNSEKTVTQQQEEPKTISAIINYVFSKYWSFEKILDSNINDFYDSVMKIDTFGFIVFFMIIFGLSGNALNFGGILNTITCFGLLKMFKKEEQFENNDEVFEKSSSEDLPSNEVKPEEKESDS